MIDLLWKKIDTNKNTVELRELPGFGAQKSQRPDWPEYWLNVALAVAQRSTCLKFQAGAVLVGKNRKIVSTGYNGAYSGAPNCSDRHECMSESRGKACDIVHAELNAIFSATPEHAAGGILYVVATSNGELADATPCEMCFRVIRNAAIDRCVYVNALGAVLDMKIGWPV